MAYQSSHTGQAIDEAVIKVSQLLDLFYPVGSIYTSTKNTNPATTLGGTWTQIKDRFLLCAGDSYSAGTTGGSTTHTHTSAAHTHTTAGHTLTVNEMPSHVHPGLYWYNPGDMSYVITLNNGTYGYHLSWNGAGGSTTAGGGNNEVGIHTGYQGGGASHSHGNTGSTTP